MRKQLWHIARSPGVAVAIAVLVIVVGVLVEVVPSLIRRQALSAGVPAPPALSSVAQFSVAPSQSACMSLVTVEPTSKVAKFSLRPVSAHGGEGSSSAERQLKDLPRPPVELRLTAQGYRASAVAHGGYGAKSVALPIHSPSNSVLAHACFVNRGAIPVLLEGTREARTVTRSSTMVDGTAVVGDVALSFLKSPQQSLISGLGGVFAHASALTEGLIPVWLMWLVFVAIAVCLPLGVIMAFYLALRDDAMRSG